MLDRETSVFLLQQFKPSLVISGDDHFFCEVDYHVIPHPDDLISMADHSDNIEFLLKAKDLTVATFSWLQGLAD
jgi:hypothetical protein